MGYHAKDPKIRMQEAVRVRSRLQRNTATEDSRCRRARCAIERDTNLTQVQGPRGEVKPLLPAFLYYGAIPHEEYKVLVTEH
jgi:hypothetical protein